ncbi:MAG TPA: acyl-CoA thioesterase domain-containing protein [Amycolatopsis sp.]|nr:acyl-CoA thioesterase domain-containing protein [Amycolatopsis sp.]
MSSASAGRPHYSDVDVVELLDLERVDRDFFRAHAVFDDPLALYGGQVAAQALRAAGLTVPEGRLPHSLHGYFLRSGNAARPVVFRVDRDRDGRSFSARRVVAVQNGEVIFNMSASFHQREDGPDQQVEPMPDAGDPERLPPYMLPRLASIEARLPEQPYPGPHWPTRFWARCTAPLGDDPLLHAAVLTYVSDILTGLSPLDAETHQPGPSLDHAVWFHRPIRLDDWVLTDLVPHRVAGGRGWYTGTMHDRDGALGASLTQETLYRAKRGDRDR